MQKLTLASILVLVVMGSAVSAFLLGQTLSRQGQAAAPEAPSQPPPAGQTVLQQPQSGKNMTSLLTSPPAQGGTAGSGDDGGEGSGGFDD